MSSLEQEGEGRKGIRPFSKLSLWYGFVLSGSGGCQQCHILDHSILGALEAFVHLSVRHNALCSDSLRRVLFFFDVAFPSCLKGSGHCPIRKSPLNLGIHLYIVWRHKLWVLRPSQGDFLFTPTPIIGATIVFFLFIHVFMWQSASRSPYLSNYKASMLCSLTGSFPIDSGLGKTSSVRVEWTHSVRKHFLK